MCEQFFKVKYFKSLKLNHIYHQSILNKRARKKACRRVVFSEFYAEEMIYKQKKIYKLNIETTTKAL